MDEETILKKLTTEELLFLADEWKAYGTVLDMLFSAFSGQGNVFDVILDMPVDNASLWDTTLQIMFGIGADVTFGDAYSAIKEDAELIRIIYQLLKTGGFLNGQS